MLLTITTQSGLSITAPEQKWLTAVLVMLADCAPEQFLKVCSLVDNKVDAYATLPASVQRSLTGHEKDGR